MTITTRPLEPAIKAEPEAFDLPSSAPDPSALISASVDFSHLMGVQLLVYGWIAGFEEQASQASFWLGDTEIHLAAYARRFCRPDVSQHFSTSPDMEHGFYLLVDLQHPLTDADSLLLSITLKSGETHESRWPIQRHDAPVSSLPQSDVTTLRGILRKLPALDRLRLSRFLSGGSESAQGFELSRTLPAGAQFEVDFCCVLDACILVAYGWLLDPTHKVTALELGVGNEVFDILRASTFVMRVDIKSDTPSYRHEQLSRPPGFILVQPITAKLSASNEIVVAITTKGAEPSYLTRPICWAIPGSRSEFVSLLSKMDVIAGMLLIDRISLATRNVSGMQSLGLFLETNHDRLLERLPPSIQTTNRGSRYWLHLDYAIPVAKDGVLLSGWCYVEGDTSARIFCHSGEASAAVNGSWIRHTRRDVTTYLEAAGIHANDDEHGFTCYVPIHSIDRPYWLSMTSEEGAEQRMKLPGMEHRKTALQTVRSLLGTFHCEHRELRALFDQQVGPAVKAAWAARPKPSGQAVVERFGAVSEHPQVSVIVPLYGRFDFAEYQMSQFANDDEFKDLDLIYVVDDPSIYDKFRLAAPSLFGIYGIPFTIAFSGTNLGFAGANNFGARHARGRFILLLNSDVFPKHVGWVGELLWTYKSLSEPGMLGVKLLYEDGTLQHAGIEFRRHLPWGGMWVNDHPLKGQMCPELKGTREATAVTAACALIEADLYRELNGFSEDYIVGDFEDSDLCLRARQAGRKNYISLDVELYHLERQSQNQTGDALWRSNLTAYNCWLHDRRWSPTIEEIMTAASTFGSDAGSGARALSGAHSPEAPAIGGGA